MSKEWSSGAIRKWIAEKAYGFIADDDGGDLFVHLSAIRGRIEPEVGARCSYLIETQEDGRRRAVNVVLAGESEAAD